MDCHSRDAIIHDSYNTYSLIIKVPLILVLLVIFHHNMAYADNTTYHVSKSGSNSNTCTAAQTEGTAKLTIAAGLSCMTGPGDKLIIHNGTYAENISGSQLDSGTDYGSGAVTVEGNASDTVILDGSISILSPGTGITKEYIIFKNLILDENGFFVGGGGGGGSVHHIKFDDIDAGNGMFSYTVSQIGGDDGVGDTVWVVNSKIHDCSSDNPPELPQECHGLYIQTSNNIIENTELYNLTGHGIHNYAEGGNSPSNNIYRNLYIHGTGTYVDKIEFAILMAVGTSNTAYNNLIINNQEGIRIYAGNTAYNNTLYGNGVGFGGECCYGAIRVEQSGSTVRNNIIYGNQINGIDNPGGGIVSNNLCQSSGSGCIVGNPNFINAGGNDFRLQSSSTAAIDQGLTIASVTTDYLGISRPQGTAYDIGAYEFVQADTTDPIVTITAPTSNTTYSTATTPITTIAGTATDAVGTTSVTWSNAATSGSGSASGCSGQTSCNWSVSSIALNEGPNAITITGTDAASNDGTDTITVTLDSTSPTRSDGSPSGTLAAGTTSTSISLTTNETATCKYGTSAGISYASQPNTFSSTNSTSHSTSVSGLSDGNSYTYYVRCQDSLNNANTDDFTISFSVTEPAIVLPDTPTSISTSASSTASIPGTVISLITSASSTSSLPGVVVSLSDLAGSTPSFPGKPTGVSGL